MKKNRIVIYFIDEPRKDSFFWGDRYFIGLIKKIFYPKKISSLERVFINLCKGFDLLKVDYVKNLPFHKIEENDRCYHTRTRNKCIERIYKTNKVIAGIGLMTHPSNWPTLFEEYPIAVYLQHSDWTAEIYNRWYGQNHCVIWPSGIDTDFWKPAASLTGKHIFSIC